MTTRRRAGSAAFGDRSIEESARQQVQLDRTLVLTPRRGFLDPQRPAVPTRVQLGGGDPLADPEEVLGDRGIQDVHGDPLDPGVEEHAVGELMEFESVPEFPADPALRA